jgi:sarcosine oxidase subunit beta
MIKNRTDAVIIGGGITGCALAYYLTKKGMKDVVLLEKSFLGSGSTGRCPGGFRHQHGSEDNIKFAKASVNIWRRLEEELGRDIKFEQRGYLMLATTEEEVEKLQKGLGVQHKLGVKSEYVSPNDAKRISPMLNEDMLLGAAYCSSDGFVDPFKAVEAYSQKARNLGVEMNLYTKVIDLKVKRGAISAVVTDKGDIETRVVVNAAGAYSREIADMVGIVLPTKTRKVDVIATEPVQHVIDPLIIDMGGGVWCGQTWRGEILAGIRDPQNPTNYNLDVGLETLRRMTKRIYWLLPGLGVLNVIRQWSGLIDLTPDLHPILGRTEEIDGFLQANGLSGHGFQLAPKIAELMAELIVDNKTSIPIEKFGLQRFRKKEEIESDSYQFAG